MNTTSTLTSISVSNQQTNHRWLVIITIMLVAILEVLDSTIVNVALPAMMPSLGADQEQITWVLTSYVVASAIMLPLTGFLVNQLGQKRLLLIDVTGFMLSSLFCGMTHSLGTMVIFRLFQGAFGSSMIPISQAVLRQTFSKKEQGKAMAIWGIGVMVAPVLGPTLGGFITEHSSWRWVFYINLPVCILGVILTLLFIPKTKAIKQKIDYLGVIMMFIGVGALQVFLDQGNSKDWFSSDFILFLAATSVICTTIFIIRNLTNKHPVIKMSIFKDCNFTVSTLSLAIFSGGVFGMITLQPILLETLFNYTALNCGITMAPMGIASAFAMVFSSILMRKFNVKFIVVISLLICAAGMFYLTRMDLASAQINFMLADILVGFGMGCFMVPISTYSLISLKSDDIAEGSGLFSYGRMLGSSIGISILSTMATRLSQINWHRLGGRINPFNNSFKLWLQHAHLSLKNKHTLGMLGNVLHHQSSMIAFNDCFYAIMFALLALIPLVLLLKNMDLSDAEIGGH